MSERNEYKIAAVTMLRDDLFYLKIWLAYYGEMLGRETAISSTMVTPLRSPKWPRGAISLAFQGITTRTSI